MDHTTETHEIPARERWLSALCYLSVLVFIPMLVSDRTPFRSRHCRQGFALLFAEVVGAFAILIIDSTLGLIPILGFILVILLRLAFFLAALSLSVLGCVKALFGETWRIPYLDDLADRIPIHD
jgi:uncharacterized membrane protein